MSNIAIKVENLSKLYRKDRRPRTEDGNPEFVSIGLSSVPRLQSSVGGYK